MGINQKGITLIEIVIVMFILGFLATVAILRIDEEHESTKPIKQEVKIPEQIWDGVITIKTANGTTIEYNASGIDTKTVCDFSGGTFTLRSATYVKTWPSRKIKSCEYRENEKTVENKKAVTTKKATINKSNEFMGW